MTTPKAALRRWQRWALYGSTSFLWVTGALWLYYKHYGQVQGRLWRAGQSRRALSFRTPWRLSHGLSFVLGSLWIHSCAWRGGSRKNTGLRASRCWSRAPFSSSRAGDFIMSEIVRRSPLDQPAALGTGTRLTPPSFPCTCGLRNAVNFFQFAVEPSDEGAFPCKDPRLKIPF